MPDANDEILVEPEFVFNHDVRRLHAMINRYISELAHMQSSAASGVYNPADISRIKTYLKSLVDFKNWVQAQPTLDLPETHPRKYALEPSPVVNDPESEAVGLLIDLFVALRYEMVNSQSARVSTRLYPFDEGRFDSIVAKMERFVVDYIEPTTPIDLPETSPDEQMTVAGRRGVLA